jgi:uncharacterized radical SAM superfamily Fe-S cluster-containing enzyme
MKFTGRRILVLGNNTTEFIKKMINQEEYKYNFIPTQDLKLYCDGTITFIQKEDTQISINKLDLGNISDILICHENDENIDNWVDYVKLIGINHRLVEL